MAAVSLSERRVRWLRHVAMCVLMTSAPASAQLATVRVQPHLPPAPSESRSIGRPDRGRLVSSELLSSTPYLYTRETHRVTTYGTHELVTILRRAAEHVSHMLPGARLQIGDLSAQRGGRLPPHRSHRSGRDADIGFYLLDEENHVVEAPRFINLGRRGTGRFEGRLVHFDAERNWTLIEALVFDPAVRVQYVLIAPQLRRLLLEEGRRRNVSAEVMARVELATHPHSGSAAHRSHFHVRVYCAADDRPQCIDEPPFHPWYDGAVPTPVQPPTSG
jgi:penicillin-insensitive murein DD-endopeptidase